MSIMSSGKAAFAQNGAIARRIASGGGMMQKYGNRGIKAGGMRATAGKALKNAGRTTARYPRRVGAGVGLSTGAMAANRRRGSQNYPMY